jgi:DNA mismatch endonuclease (patch repair protein)
MADIVSRETRSRMMSGIRGKNTKPELQIRKGLHRLGFRYRLHVKTLPGKPDIVFPRYRAVIFVHGCFWHGHNCHMFKKPKTRPNFWLSKIAANRARDALAYELLSEAGWRISEVWECAVKGRLKMPLETVVGQCADWLKSDRASIDIRGC